MLNRKFGTSKSPTFHILTVVQHLPKPINMIKLYIIILSILLPSITFSQQLTIDETLEYISEQHSENNPRWCANPFAFRIS